MRKEYNGLYWTIVAGDGMLLVNESARVASSVIYTADENATGWTEMPAEDVPSFEEEDDLSTDEALSIITGEVAE